MFKNSLLLQRTKYNVPWKGLLKPSFVGGEHQLRAISGQEEDRGLNGHMSWVFIHLDITAGERGSSLSKTTQSSWKRTSHDYTEQQVDTYHHHQVSDSSGHYLLSPSFEKNHQGEMNFCYYRYFLFNDLPV